MIDPHMIGFEKEELFSSALIECRMVHDTFKAKTLKTALQVICPQFMDGLYAVLPCSRKLKFIGNGDMGENAADKDFDPFFKPGEIYESIDFNGGTYRIKGYDHRVGCSYFEVC